MIKIFWAQGCDRIVLVVLCNHSQWLISYSAILTFHRFKLFGFSIYV